MPLILCEGYDRDRMRLPRGASIGRYELWEYPMAGHAMGPPDIGTNLSLGGTLSANAQASQDAWLRLRAFLRMHLGDFGTP